MPQEPSNRKQQLAQIATLLQSPDGVVLMKELEDLWDGPLMGETPEVTHYNVGLRDAFKTLVWLQTNATE